MNMGEEGVTEENGLTLGNSLLETWNGMIFRRGLPLVREVFLYLLGTKNEMVWW